jgi:hypothetical protein
MHPKELGGRTWIAKAQISALLFRKCLSVGNGGVALARHSFVWWASASYLPE